MIKHLLSGALLLAFVASCTSEPVTDNPADEPTAKPEAPAQPARRLTLTYYNIEG
ncbi:MAG: hypothetical protein ACE37K_21750 [Planctomycetota bacterium]